MNPKTCENLTPTRTDYLRFLAAVTGRRVDSVDAYPLTSAFLPFAVPAWDIVGAADMPGDGARGAAIPCLVRGEVAVVPLGQSVRVHQPAARYEPLRRVSVVVSEENTDGRYGPARLLTVQRRTIAGRGRLATQIERYAVRKR